MEESLVGVTKAVADFIYKTEYEDLPKSVIDKVKLCILDFIGNAIGGSKEPEVKILANLVKSQGGKEESTVISHNFKAPMPNAGMVNAAMGHALQIDDGDRFTLAHLGTEIIPAALAVGEVEGSGGEDLINAIALGYEVAMRIGYAVNPSHHKRGFCPNSTLGVFGAAATASKLMKLGVQEIADAIGSAGTLASGVEEFVVDGSGGQFLNPAHATYAGILSALLARNGFTGSKTILEGTRGFCKAFSDEYDLSLITANLGIEYQMAKVYFKPYPTCRAMHSAIDAILNIVRKYSIEPEDIKKIIVKTYSYNVNLMCGPPPRTVAHARLHMPYALAIALKEKRLTVNEFKKEKLRDARVLDLMSKIEFLTADEELNRFAPYLFGTIVSVLTKDGKEYVEKVAFPKGEPENPMTQEELIEKFKSLILYGGFDETKANKLISIINKLEQVKEIDELTKLL
jgi:2-methylcitrate dehydratase PrpD